MAKIAAQLYTDKYPTPDMYNRGSTQACIWNRSQILHIISDEQYIGTCTAGRTKKSDVGDKKAIAVAVRRAISRKAAPLHNRKIGTSRRYGMPDYPLKGKVRCGCCNHTMQLSATKNARFRCTFTSSITEAACHHMSISARELTDMLYEIISKQAKIILNIDSLCVLADYNAQAERQADIEKKMAQINGKKRTLYEGFVLKEIDAVSYKAEKSLVDAELDCLSQTIYRMKREAAEIAAEKAKSVTLYETASAVLGENTLTRALVDLLIDKVVIYPGERVEVAWKVSDFSVVK